MKIREDIEQLLPKPLFDPKNNDYIIVVKNPGLLVGTDIERYLQRNLLEYYYIPTVYYCRRNGRVTKHASLRDYPNARTQSTKYKGFIEITI